MNRPRQRLPNRRDVLAVAIREEKIGLVDHERMQALLEAKDTNLGDV